MMSYETSVMPDLRCESTSLAFDYSSQTHGHRARHWDDKEEVA